jgi:putative ABC transport system permease protein
VLGDLLLRLLLMVLPRSLRRAHGREMRQLARDRWREASASSRAFARTRVTLSLAADVLRVAPVEHLNEWRSRPLKHDPPRSPGQPMSDLLTDLRYALRLAALSPVFTGAAILTLALGIGATTAIYGLADTTILRPLPVRDVNSLYATRWSASHPSFRDYLARTDAFAGVVAFSGRDAFSLQRGDSTALAAGAFVSGNYFGVLGVDAQVGRVLVRSDDRGPGGALVAVLSDRYWRTQYNTDPAIVGTTLRVNGRSALVVGVAARGFRGVTLQADPAIWMPLSSFSEVETAPFFRRVDPLKSRGMVWLRVVMRLKPGVTPEQASAVIAATYKANHPDQPDTIRDADEAAEIHPLTAMAVGFKTRHDLSRFLLLLGGVVAFTLLVACANLSNMLLVRANARRREIAVRLALGAARGRLVRQMLTEHLSIALAGGAAGLFVARWMIALLARFELPGEIPIEDLRLGLGGPSLGVALGASLATAALFGLVPALQASALGIVGALRDQGRATSRHRLRGALIAAQVALSLVLLAGGALFVRGLERALRTDVGFRPEGVATATVDLGLARYEAERARQFYDTTLEHIHALPTVRAAAWTSRVPMRGVMMWTIEVEGFTPTKGREVPADVTYVHGRYFAALGIPLLEGRALDASDRDGAPLAAVINRAMAAKFWARRAALGGRFRFDTKSPWVDVVGIVGDVRGRGIDEEVMPTMYLPFLQHRSDTLLDAATVVARTDRDAGTIEGALVSALRSVDDQLPVARVMTLEDHVRAQVMPQRMGVRLFSFFGTLALLIAAVGIYGVAAAAVVERTRELGIRMALGARARQVVALVQRQTLVPVAAGIVMGLLLANWSAKLVGALLYGLDPDDPAAFTAVAVALAGVGLLAAWIPARRAAKVDPAITLRTD